MKHTLMAMIAVGVLGQASASASLSSKVELRGKVSDFDERFVFLNAITERYRIKRDAVPDSVPLTPGSFISLEVPLRSFTILPATAPLTPPENYKPPRKRVPARE